MRNAKTRRANQEKLDGYKRPRGQSAEKEKVQRLEQETLLYRARPRSKETPRESEGEAGLDGKGGTPSCHLGRPLWGVGFPEGRGTSWRERRRGQEDHGIVHYHVLMESGSEVARFSL